MAKLDDNDDDDVMVGILAMVESGPPLLWVYAPHEDRWVRVELLDSRDAQCIAASE